jgi:hypothetical protein
MQVSFCRAAACGENPGLDYAIDAYNDRGWRIKGIWR